MLLDILNTIRELISRYWKRIILMCLLLVIILVLAISLMKRREMEVSRQAAVKELNMKQLYYKALERTDTVIPLVPKEDR